MSQQKHSAHPLSKYDLHYLLLQNQIVLELGHFHHQYQLLVQNQVLPLSGDIDSKLQLVFDLDLVKGTRRGS